MITQHYDNPGKGKWFPQKCFWYPGNVVWKIGGGSKDFSTNATFWWFSRESTYVLCVRVPAECHLVLKKNFWCVKEEVERIIILSMKFFLLKKKWAQKGQNFHSMRDGKLCKYENEVPGSNGKRFSSQWTRFRG